MERSGQEPIPPLDIEQVFGRVELHQMLQFDGMTVQLIEFLQTETREVSDGRYTYWLPVTHPILCKEVASLSDLFEVDPIEQEALNYDDGHISTQIEGDDFRAWSESLVRAEDIKAAALAELKRRETEGDEETQPCYNCQGEGKVESDRYPAIYGENFADGPVDCTCCDGAGKTTKYPTIILHNEMNSDERILRLDMAALIAQGELEIIEEGHEKSYPEGVEGAERVIRLSVSNYIDRNIAEMGINLQNAARVNQDNIIEGIHNDTTDPVALHALWNRDHLGNKLINHNFGSDMDAADMLKACQKYIAQKFSSPYGKIKDAYGMVTAEKWTIRPLRPVQQALDELITVVTANGYKLGYAPEPIDAGRAGPTFFLLNGHGERIGNLSDGYTVWEAVENSWIAFQQLQNGEA